MTQPSTPGAVVMAVHRPDHALLERQMRSLQGQECTDWTCHVGIDGHDPATHAFVVALVGEDRRFHVHHFDENVGVYRHFERLLALVPTNEVGWVALADQDDDWHATKLTALLSALGAPGVTAVVGRARLVEDGHVTGTTERRVGGFASTLLVNHVTGSLAVFRPAVVAAALPFPPGNDAAIHDHWLAVCAAAGGRIVQIDRVVQDYVQHRENVIGEPRRHSWRDAMDGLRVSGGPLRLVDEYVGDRWVWRVEMARAVRERRLPPELAPVARAVATGAPAGVLVRAVLRAVARREVTVLEGVALTSAAARWRHRNLDGAQGRPG
ncbi:glycosyltransferase [Pedococcus soli]